MLAFQSRADRARHEQPSQRLGISVGDSRSGSMEKSLSKNTAPTPGGDLKKGLAVSDAAQKFLCLLDQLSKFLAVLRVPLLRCSLARE